MSNNNFKEFAPGEFKKLTDEWRYVITDMICRAKSGHIGGALSLVEVFATLYYKILNVDPKNPKWDGRDRMIMSKGHAAPVWYVALAYKGYFPMDWLPTLNADGTKLPSHADERFVPGVDATTGSLGQGLSMACGMALAGKRDGKKHSVFCIIGDGETNEGQNWEAAMFASHNKLDNLIAITDCNKLQIDGFTRDILGLEPLAEKWRAFGWEVFEMDGHCEKDIYETLTKAKAVTGKPTMVIANTIKGKGCSLIADTPGSHNIKVADQAAYDKYMGALDETNVTLPY